MSRDGFETWLRANPTPGATQVTANTSFECVDPGTFVVVCNVCGCGWYVLFDQTAESKRVALRLLNRHYDKHTRNIDCSK
jgi:hypothetical protein